MKKLTLVLLVLLAVASLTGPGISGHFLKSYHDDMTAQFNRQYPMYTLAYEQLEDGWFSSRYRYNAEFKIPAAASANAEAQAQLKQFTQFSSELTYYHGPLPFAALANDAPFYPAAGTYSYEFDYAQALADLMTDAQPENTAAIAALPPVTGTGWIQYNNDVFGTANLPANTLMLKDGSIDIKLDFGAFSASSQANLSTGQSQIVASLPSFSLTPMSDKDEGSVQISGITMDINGATTTNHVPLINGFMKVAEVDFRTNDYSGETSGKLSGFDYSFTGSQQGDYVDSSAQMGFERFSNNDISLDSASWQFAYSHMHEPSLGKLYQQYQQIAAGLYQDPDNFERQFEQKLAELEPQAIALLHHKPVLSSKILYRNKNGSGEINALMNIDKASEEQLQSIQTFSQAAALMPNVYGKVTANIPEAVAKDVVGIAVDQELNAARERGREVADGQREQMIQQMLGMPVMMGYLTLVEAESGDKTYTGEAIFENLKLLLNGNEIPLDQLM